MEPLLMAIMFVGSFVGVQIGVWAVGKLPAKRIRQYFTVVSAIGILIILWDLSKQLWL